MSTYELLDGIGCEGLGEHRYVAKARGDSRFAVAGDENKGSAARDQRFGDGVYEFAAKIDIQELPDAERARGARALDHARLSLHASGRYDSESSRNPSAITRSQRSR